MRRMVLVACVAMIGCGSSSGGGKVDPNALDACLAWTNGVCRLAFLCVDTTAQDATFTARYGTTQDACLDKLLARCQSNQSGDVFGPSCGPGKVVNQAQAQTCQMDVDTLSCVDWMPMQAVASCTTICGSSATGTGGMGGGGGSMGTGGTTGTGGTNGTGVAGGRGTDTYVDFCYTYGYAVCDKQFACDSTMPASDCRTLIDAICPYATCSSTYNAQSGASCIPAVMSATCDQLSGPPPAACTASCPM